MVCDHLDGWVGAVFGAICGHRYWASGGVPVFIAPYHQNAALASAGVARRVQPRRPDPDRHDLCRGFRNLSDDRYAVCSDGGTSFDLYLAK